MASYFRFTRLISFCNSEFSEEFICLFVCGDGGGGDGGDGDGGDGLGW